jgi:hypothetical protein
VDLYPHLYNDFFVPATYFANKNHDKRSSCHQFLVQLTNKPGLIQQYAFIEIEVKRSTTDVAHTKSFAQCSFVDNESGVA